MTQLKMLSADDKLAEIRRLYFNASKSSIQQDLAKALDRPSLRVLRRTVGALSRGEPVIPIPQDPAKATEAPLSEDAALALSFSAPTEIVLRHIRAFSPDGWFELGGRTVSIARARSAPCPPQRGVAAGRRVNAGQGLGRGRRRARRRAPRAARHRPARAESGAW